MDQLFLLNSQQKVWQQHLFSQLKINDTISLFLAFFGIILAYFEYEDFYGKTSFNLLSSGTYNLIIISEQYVEKPFNRAFRVIIGVSSVFLCFTIFRHYKLKLSYLKLRQKIDQSETLVSTKMVYFLIFELLICIIHCPPGCNWVFSFEQYGGSLVYSFDMCTFLAMLLRTYLIWRVLGAYSSWSNDMSEDICNSCLCEGGAKFALKAEIKERTYAFVGLVLFLSIIIFGIALRTAERPFMYYSQKDWDYAWNGMWCIVITMATVGYGDFYPVTHLGRCIGVFACFWGTFLTSLMVLSMTINSELTLKERNAYDVIKKKETQMELEVAASNTIKSALKLRIYLKNSLFIREKEQVWFINKFKKALMEYRALKKNVRAKEQDEPFEYILAKLHEKVIKGLEDAKKCSLVYKNLLARFDIAEGNQERLKENIRSLKQSNAVAQKMLENVKSMKNSMFNKN